MSALFKPAQQNLFRRSAYISRIDKLVLLQRLYHNGVDAHSIAAQDICKHLIAHYSCRRWMRAHSSHRLLKTLLARLARLTNKRAPEPFGDSLGPPAEYGVTEYAHVHMVRPQLLQPRNHGVCDLLLMPGDQRIIEVQDNAADSSGSKMRRCYLRYRFDYSVRAENQPTGPFRMLSRGQMHRGCHVRRYRMHSHRGLLSYLHWRDRSQFRLVRSTRRAPASQRPRALQTCE